MAWRYCLARGLGWNWVVLVVLREKAGLMASRLARVSAQGTTDGAVTLRQVDTLAGLPSARHVRASTGGQATLPKQDRTGPLLQCTRLAETPAMLQPSTTCCGSPTSHGRHTLLCSARCLVASLCARAANALHSSSRQTSHPDSRSLHGPPCGSTGTACRVDCRRVRLWLWMDPAEAARLQSKSLSRMAPIAAICRAEDESDLMLLKFSRPSTRTMSSSAPCAASN